MPSALVEPNRELLAASGGMATSAEPARLVAIRRRDERPRGGAGYRNAKTPRQRGFRRGALWGTRTPDPFLTMEVLYRLS